MTELCSKSVFAEHHGGVARWSERWSLTGKLSLTYAWSTVDRWPLLG